jgi:hypothetical protein
VAAVAELGSLAVITRMTHEALSEFLVEHGLVLGLFTDESGTVLARAGDFDAADFHWLSHVDPPWIPTTTDQIRYMIEWLDGKILPQMASQGDAYVLLMRPLGKFFAAFGVHASGRGVTWVYHHSKAVSHSLETGLLGKVSI